MGFLENNLALLRRNEPSLAEKVANRRERSRICVDIAANGEPTLKVRGLALHSYRDPGKEGENWARRAALEHNLPEAGEVTVLGFGLGYHLKGLAERQVRGTVIEPDLEMFATALEHMDLTDVLENYRVIAGVSQERLRRAHGDQLTGILLPHSPSLRLHPDSLGTLNSYGNALRLAKGGGMKILLVNPINGGSLPIARYCASALKGMGHMVTTFGAEAFSGAMDFADNYRFERSGRHSGTTSPLQSRAVLSSWSRRRVPTWS